MARDARSWSRAVASGLALLPLAAALVHGALGPRYGGRLRVGVVELPATLEPGLPHGPGERLVVGLVHETLVGVGPEGLPMPRLASAWTSAAGGREWTLTLAGGARFHDGRAVTADDVVLSLRRFLRSASPAAERLADSLEGGSAFRARHTAELPGLALSGASQVVLRLVEPRPLPLAPLAAPGAAVTAASGTGCGPFVPTVNLPGRRLTLNAFGAHVHGRPYFDELDLTPSEDPVALHADWQAGRVDVALGEPGTSALAATLLLLLDPARPPFDRPDARAAAVGAIDRADLVRHWLPGAEASPSLLTPGLLAPPGTASPPPARGAAAGRVTLSVARDVPVAASRRVIALLSDAGFSVRVEPQSPGRARLARAEARLILFSPEVAEPGLALHELVDLALPPPEVRAVLEAADVERDLDRRRALLLRAEAALRSDRVVAGLASVPVSAGSAAPVHGVQVDLSGRVHLEDAWREP